METYPWTWGSLPWHSSIVRRWELATGADREELNGPKHQLLQEAYGAVRTLRLLLQNHPSAAPLVEEMDQNVRRGEM